MRASSTRLLLSITTALVIWGTSSTPALAYEGPGTHVGLTTEATMASRLHAFLRKELGVGLGLFARLQLQGEAMDSRVHRLLQFDLGKLNPGGGYRPDKKDGQFAVAWALAGAVLAEMPASENRHHFLCPATVQGLMDPRPVTGWLLGLLATLEGGDTVRQFFTGTGFDLTGKLATDWLFAPENRHGVGAFHKHLAAAISEAEPGRRDHHLALALTSLGAMLHVLQDMASPTHVRNDFARGHLEKLGSGSLNRGAAYERFVAQRYGRLGIPGYKGPAIKRASLRDFFHSSRWDGLADLTHLGHFSPGTLPAETSVRAGADLAKLQARLTSSLPFEEPALGKVDLACAAKKSCYLRAPGSKRPLLAYRLSRKGKLMFRLDPRVHAAAARELLPMAVGFSAGFIDHLLRGQVDLSLKTADQVEVINKSADLTAGRVRIFAEDEAGKRTSLAEHTFDEPVKAGAALATLAVKIPRGTKRLVALLEGTEHKTNDPLVATKLLGL